MNQESDLDLMREMLRVSTDPSERARHEARASLLDLIDAEDHVAAATRVRRRIWAAGNRRVGVLAAALVIGASSAAAATVAALHGFGHDSPTRLFDDNPARLFSPWVTQALVPGTVRLVTTLRVPTWVGPSTGPPRAPIMASASACGSPAGYGPDRRVGLRWAAQFPAACTDSRRTRGQGGARSGDSSGTRIRSAAAGMDGSSTEQSRTLVVR